MPRCLHRPSLPFDRFRRNVRAGRRCAAGAVRNGLSGLALTDHDTIGGVHEAAEAAGSWASISCPASRSVATFPSPARCTCWAMASTLPTIRCATSPADLIDARNDRNPRIIRRLNELGVRSRWRKSRTEAGGGGGRPATHCRDPASQGVRQLDQAGVRQIPGAGRRSLFRQGAPHPPPRRSKMVRQIPAGCRCSPIPCSFARRTMPSSSVSLRI